ncbi:conserved hypothetical protein [Alkaliphilus oremlandii OhILAs]|uniref:Carboxypeptidase regulatory-like domain-containing protein n=2 Tax=Alkaliphilus oremlandii TaxID=461876 RepID=A8MFT8_ALKOO|nr:conserved hypothetical protein [Alkaliphilus oremlandii OhILAs]
MLSITFISLFIAMILYFSFPSILLKMGEKFSHDGDYFKAKTYYDKINENFPKASVTESALEKAGYVSAIHNKIMISSSGFGPIYNSNHYIFPETRAYYEEILQRFPRGLSAQRVRYNLLIPDVQGEVLHGNVEEAIEMIKSFYANIHNETPRYMNAYTINGAIQAFEVKGYDEEAKDLLRWIIDYEDDWEKNIFQDYLSRLENSKDAYGSVTGKVSLRGKSFKNIPVFLQYQDTPDGTLYGFTQEAFWAITDNNGNFEFPNIPEGRYTVGLIGDLDQIGDTVLQGNPFEHTDFTIEKGQTYDFNISFVDRMKIISPVDGEEIKEDFIQFQWEPLEGAAYYTIALGISFEGASGTRIYGKYNTNEALVSKEDILYLHNFHTFDEEGPIPEPFFGFMNPKGQLFWGVHAYDENDRLLSSSIGYIRDESTEFSIGEIELTEGDKKLLKRDYAGAIESYEQSLAENKEDIHSLLMLARLYNFEQKLSNYTYGNKEKAKEYYRRLHKITGNEIFLENSN